MRARRRVMLSMPAALLVACISCVREGDAPSAGAPSVDGDFPDASAVAGPPPPDGAVRLGPPIPVVSKEGAPSPDGERSSSAPAEAAASVTPDADPLWRADGRPTWWLADPSREAGRVAVTGEAIGSDILAARRASIDAARRTLRAAIGRDIEGERVEAAVVRRLAGDAPGRDRFVGYVRLSGAQ